MQENRFVAAGWAAIAAAVIFPTAFIVEGLHEVAFEMGLSNHPMGIGPGDFLFLLFMALSIYVYKAFKQLMFERYSFRGLGTIINVAIAWHIVYFLGGFLLELVLSTVLSERDLGTPLVLLLFYAPATAFFGIIDIIIAVILMRSKSRFSTSVRAFAVFSLIVGIAEATVIGSFLNLLLVPAMLVVMAVVFLGRPEDEVEFV